MTSQQLPLPLAPRRLRVVNRLAVMAAWSYLRAARILRIEGRHGTWEYAVSQARSLRLRASRFE